VTVDGDTFSVDETWLTRAITRARSRPNHFDRHLLLPQQQHLQSETERRCSRPFWRPRGGGSWDPQVRPPGLGMSRQTPRLENHGVRDSTSTGTSVAEPSHAAVGLPTEADILKTSARQRPARCWPFATDSRVCDLQVVTVLVLLAMTLQDRRRKSRRRNHDLV